MLEVLTELRQVTSGLLGRYFSGALDGVGGGVIVHQRASTAWVTVFRIVVIAFAVAASAWSRLQRSRRAAFRVSSASSTDAGTVSAAPASAER